MANKEREFFYEINNMIENNETITITERKKEWLKTNFPAFTFEKYMLVENAPNSQSPSRLAIDDISYRTTAETEEAIIELASACKGELIIYDARKLVSASNEQLKTIMTAKDPHETLIIFPGNGAKTVYDLIEKKIVSKTQTIDVETKRNINTKGAVIGVEITNKEKLQNTVTEIQPKSIIVADDVAVSGETLVALKNSLDMNQTEWSAAPLMTLIPPTKPKRYPFRTSQSSILGYDRVITPIAYNGTAGTPPLNSLSTLVAPTEQSEKMREKYIEKYVQNKPMFQNAVTKLQKAIK